MRLQLLLEGSLETALNGIHVLVGGDIVLALRLASGKGKILGHDTVNIDSVNASLLKALSKGDNLGGVVELATLDETTGPGEDGGNGIFLQDGEAHGDADDAEGGHTGGRKTRGSRGERGGRASTRGKRVSAAARSAAAADRDVDASMDEDQELASTPAVRGKRKRNAEDDTGYKPRGSSTRPTKKKRKSEAAEGTPSARKSKKDKEAPLASAE
ncbi:hypothetical protein FOC4_g10013462 [Fusarium odoratissimum]|uniref:Uncharacterized protein n=1 Tax=Fusarium oxysporum f. sp. cubense (strain race 4) TaxID=2502994 RepID=N1RCG3_FUSC4|nr:hypothetical protein FOC4_g10013462 [Fusarium odoratissimum]